MRINPEYFRNIIFGAEDSFVSTVGVLFGLATAIEDKSTVILTGLIVIAVESLSMGVGSYLSEEEIHEAGVKEHTDIPWVGGILMFIAYFLAGFVPLSPYYFYMPMEARFISVAVTLVALFFLGAIPTKSLKAGVRMLVVAGLAIFVGFLIGTLHDKVSVI